MGPRFVFATLIAAFANAVVFAAVAMPQDVGMHSAAAAQNHLRPTCECG